MSLLLSIILLVIVVGCNKEPQKQLQTGMIENPEMFQKQEELTSLKETKEQLIGLEKKENFGLMGKSKNYVYFLTNMQQNQFDIVAYNLNTKKLLEKPIYTFKGNSFIQAGEFIFENNLYFGVSSGLEEGGLLFQFIEITDDHKVNILTKGKTLYYPVLSRSNEHAIIEYTNKESTRIEAVNLKTKKIKKLEQAHNYTKEENFDGKVIYFAGGLENRVYYQEVDFQNKDFLEIEETQLKVWNLQTDTQEDLCKLPRRIDYLTGDDTFICTNTSAGDDTSVESGRIYKSLTKEKQEYFQIPGIKPAQEIQNSGKVKNTIILCNGNSLYFFDVEKMTYTILTLNDYTNESQFNSFPVYSGDSASYLLRTEDDNIYLVTYY